MAEEESNPGTLLVVSQTVYRDTVMVEQQFRSHGWSVSTPFLTAGMIVFLLLLWAAVGHRITARYSYSL